MTEDSRRLTKSMRQAHSAHYGTKDLGAALQLYEGITVAHPDTQEDEYSRSQIQNIVKAVVPKQDLFVAQMNLARAHLDRGQRPPVDEAPATPHAS